MSTNDPKPEEMMTQRLVQDLLKDRRRDRFWRNLRFLAVFAVFALLAFKLCSGSSGVEGDEKGDYVSLVRLDGMIAPKADFSAEQVMPVLKNAFADKRAKGVILAINSGGGTPVQAAIIHDEILRLKQKYKKSVIVVGEDLLASGAYFVAVSADKIYVNANTVTGSVGVIMEGFGFEDIIKKVGVQRRVLTSGIHKDRLDPFLPETPEDKAKVQSVIDEVHDNFNQAVLKGRQGRLHAAPEELFSGDFWTGQRALQLGLVDAIGDIYDAMQNEFKVSNFKDYSQSGSVVKMLMGQLGAYFNLPLSQSDFSLQAKLA